MRTDTQEILNHFVYDAEAGVIRVRDDAREADPRLGAQGRRNRHAGREVCTIVNNTNTGVTRKWISWRGRKIRMGRVAWLLKTGEWPDGLVLHRNGDPMDMRWDNLMLGDKSDMKTLGKLITNPKTKYRGVREYGGGKREWDELGHRIGSKPKRYKAVGVKKGWKKLTVMGLKTPEVAAWVVEMWRMEVDGAAYRPPPYLLQIMLQ